MDKRYFSKKYPALLLLVSALLPLLVALFPSSGASQVTAEKRVPEPAALAENAEVAAALEEVLASMNIAPFTYQTEGRPDPFKPFISQRAAQEAAEISPEELTGMRQFEPGQLTLVAIIFAEDNPMAMVEDSSHKGYIVRKGTRIGRSGIISEIQPNQVIIKQLSYSMTRERKYNTVEMTLRKEGEK
ncbi:MAG: pilus assembly protein PilP [Desulfurivibrionaceae bacterium]|nr:pilus assembly protein PilP [Desulfobulbales bacterium]MDT8335591.1 pilus assembly protein PilP [Desulfurivibrionaceae bacterium]